MRYSEQIWYFLLAPLVTFQTVGPFISKLQHVTLTGSSLAEYCRYGIPSVSLTMIVDERDLVLRTESKVASRSWWMLTLLMFRGRSCRVSQSPRNKCILATSASRTWSSNSPWCSVRGKPSMIQLFSSASGSFVEGLAHLALQPVELSLDNVEH